MNIARITLNKYFIPVLLLAALALLVALPYYTPAYTKILFTSIFMYIILTVSWTIFSGFTGYISLATAAFFGVGIYTAALVGNAFPLPLMLLLGGVASFVLALIVGAITLRLRGVYFTMFTFGLIELVKHVILWWEINLVGTRGRFVPRIDDVTVFYIMLAILTILLLIVYLIRRSRLGLALYSIGQCEDASMHVGINVTVVKVLAFSISSFFIGVAGSLIATRWGYIDPYIAFNPFYSFLPVLMAIFGGLGNLAGPVLGATVFSYLQEALVTRFPYYYMLIFGIIMVVTILYLPSGLIGLTQKLKTRVLGGKDAHTSS